MAFVLLPGGGRRIICTLFYSGDTVTNSIPAPTLGDLFDRSIQIENQAQAIYTELEKRFAHHPEAATLWKALAADEAIHARVLAKALASAAPEKLASEAPAEVWASVTEIMHRMSQNVVDSVKSLKDAYELAHQLEYSEVNAIFEFLTVDAIPGNLERAFVRNHIITHQKRLTDFSEGYRGQDWQDVLPQ
jgi:hypothetical protein